VTTSVSTTNPGGHVNFAIGEAPTAEYIEAMGTIGLQSLTSLIGRLAQSGDNPIDGFIGAADCKVTASGLVATIAPGWGFQYRSTETGAFVPSYLPIVVSSAHTQAITAHHATLKRHDLIGIKAIYDKDQPVVTNVYDVTGAGGWTTPTSDKRSRWYYGVAYITGTAATTPADPSMTSGYITIARLRVPATAGAITVDDMRPYWRLSRELAEDPGAEYASPFIPGTSTECLVIESATPAMTVVVSEGKAVGLGGYRSRIGRSTLAVSTADATNPRIDVVWVDADGSIGITAGTPAGSPSVPSIGFTKQSIARIAVGAAVTTIVTANITDTRVRLPYDGSQLRELSIETAHLQDLAVTRDKIEDDAVGTDQIENGTVTAAKLDTDSVTTPAILAGNVTGTKLSVVPVIPALTAAAESADTITVAIQCKDVDGGSVARVVRLECEVYTKNGESTGYTIAIGATGSVVSLTNDVGAGAYPYELVDTNASGVAEVVVSGPAGAAKGARLKVTPIGTAGYPQIVQCPFN